VDIGSAAVAAAQQTTCRDIRPEFSMLVMSAIARAGAIGRPSEGGCAAAAAA